MRRKRLTRNQAIKANCYECMGNQRIILQCTSVDCSLYPYRTGKENLGAWGPVIEKLEKVGYFKKSDAARKVQKEKQSSSVP